MNEQFTLVNSFASPVVKLARANRKRCIRHVSKDTVEYVYNSQGYRTEEFDTIPDNYAIAVGCSHTEGVGLPYEFVYSNQLSQRLGLQVINLGVASSGAMFVKKNILSWVTNIQKAPKFVIAQWPNPYRMFVYEKNFAHFELVQSPSQCLIHHAIKLSENNLLESWVSSIIETNTILRLLNIPCYNIHFQKVDTYSKEIQEILINNKVKMHFNDSCNSIWDLDSNAFDKSHHSIQCHEQWADRLINIIHE
jgi:hypothetical protein